MTIRRLTPQFAGLLARIALGHVDREYPNILVQVLNRAEEVATPRALHPVFYGSYDWHSCVHGHWMLATLLRKYPEMDESPAIRAHFDLAFTEERVAGERRFLDRAGSEGFERPYGWSWLLKLSAELGRHLGYDARQCDLALRPLAQDFSTRFKAFLPKADYPVRAGVHSNTAFALGLAHDYAVRAADTALASLIEAKALEWYAGDEDCQAWEPSGDDFLSSALIEAELMRRVLSSSQFRAWFAQFLPHAGRGLPQTLFAPVRVSDRGDGKIAHLDGLNLSRAWCWRGVASGLGSENPVAVVALEAAERHLAASLPHVQGDYMGEHWLGSFALLALLAADND
jgi:hypothetical protein